MIDSMTVSKTIGGAAMAVAVGGAAVAPEVVMTYWPVIVTFAAGFIAYGKFDERIKSVEGMRPTVDQIATSVARIEGHLGINTES